MPSTITYTDELVVTSCWCGMKVGIPENLWRAMQSDSKKRCYCPAGHTFVYSKNEATRLREQLEQRDLDLAWERSRRDQAEAEAKHQRQRAAGYKGAAAKTKKRAARAMCPADGCKRSFVNVARHIATCHPDLAVEAEP